MIPVSLDTHTRTHTHTRIHTHTHIQTQGRLRSATDSRLPFSIPVQPQHHSANRRMTMDESELKKHTVVELKEMCTERSLPVSGTIPDSTSDCLCVRVSRAG